MCQKIKGILVSQFMTPLNPGFSKLLHLHKCNHPLQILHLVFLLFFLLFSQFLKAAINTPRVFPECIPETVWQVCLVGQVQRTELERCASVALPFMPYLSMFFPQLRSLELFFATNQNNRSGDHVNDKSPRLCRKFSSPPPLSIPSRTSSPVRIRKLSLNSPIGSKVSILDLSTTSSSAASSPTSANPTISPPPSNNNNKPPLDLSHGQSPSSPEQSPGAPDENAEVPRIDALCGKLRRSIRRGEHKILFLILF